MKDHFVRETVEVFGSYDGGSLQEVIARLKEKYNTVPEEYKASVQFTLVTESEPYSDSEYPKFNMTYSRLENDKEKAKRQAEEVINAYNRDKYDREEFERLSKKFKS